MKTLLTAFGPKRAQAAQAGVEPLRTVAAKVIVAWAASCLAASVLATSALAAEFPKFAYHEIDKVGNLMGQTSLVDVDRDGKLDWIAGCSHGDLWWFRYEAPDRWVRHLIGHKVGTEVGGIAFDVDGDGLADQVSGSTWFRNPGKPAAQDWPRFANGAISNSHDNVLADVDGDGKPEVVMMQDTAGLYWYKIPADPTKPWQSHRVGPAIHGGIGPRGVADLDGDGDADVARSTGWFENADGKGTRWVWHDNLGPRHGGRFPDTTKSWIVDLDGDGRNDLVLCDAEVTPGEGRIDWYRNEDGRGGRWTRHPIAAGKGDLHTLFVGDFNADGVPDVFSGEGPLGGTGPGGKRRWFLWEGIRQKTKDGTTVRFKEHVILEGPECHEGVAADVDGDGDLDICSKPWNGNLHVYLRNLLVESRPKPSP